MTKKITGTGATFNKKAFTLIELLAVIVILAIIALIATPIILNIIRDAKDNANKRSIELYADAIKNGIAKYELNIGKVENGTYTSDTIPFDVDYNGDVYCDVVKIDDGEVSLATCKVNGEKVNYIYGSFYLGDTIVFNNGGYNDVIDLESKELKPFERDVVLPFHYGSTLYFSNTIEIDEENKLFTLTGDVIQKSLNHCKYDTCDYETYFYETAESTPIIYKNIEFYMFDDDLGFRYTATKLEFDKEYNKNAGPGFYKTEDDLGTSYYFRGNVDNNYVKLIGKKVVHHDAILEEFWAPIDAVNPTEFCSNAEEDYDMTIEQCMEEISPIIKTAFLSEEACKSAGDNFFWSNCDKFDISKVYYPKDDDGIMFRTEEDCLEFGKSNGFTDCDSKKLRNEAAYDEDVYNESYWRIVRVNGDGTIRLIYDGDSIYENGTKHDAYITKEINSWYKENLKDYYIEKFLSDTGYCDDNGTSYIINHVEYPYELYDRSYDGYNSNNPSLKCNKKIKSNIGILNVSEAAMTGSLGVTSKNNYLSGSSFRTSNYSSTHEYKDECPTNCSSHGCSSTYPCIKTKYNYYIVKEDGSLSTSTEGNTRPVINLVKDVPFTGSGTKKDPYVITVE